MAHFDFFFLLLLANIDKCFVVQEALSGGGGDKGEEGAGCKSIFPIWSIFWNSIWKYFQFDFAGLQGVIWKLCI